MMTENATLQKRDYVRYAWVGAVACLASGVIFGVMMAIQGMLPMVGMLIGLENALIGFVVHMVISAFVGVTFGLIFRQVVTNLSLSIGLGLAYGLFWWILGALTLMPLLLGLPDMVMQIGQMQIMSLFGHVIFGIVLGLVFHPLSERE